MVTGTSTERCDGDDPGDERSAALVLLFGGCALLGAALWAAWFGWDSPAGGAAQYTKAQVVGWLASVGVVVAVLARWRNPPVVAGGTAVGCWIISTAVTAADLDSGPLWIVGAMITFAVLVVVTAVAAVVGLAWRRWRGPVPVRPAPGPAVDRWRTGVALVVVGGCWLLVGPVARQVYPLGWSYTAVLRVPLDLVGVAAVVGGVVLAARSVRRRRARRLPLRPLAPAAGFAAAVVVLAAFGRTLPAGDGFTGQVGVMAGPDGALVALLGLCEGTVDSLLVQDLVNEQSSQEGDDHVPAARLHHDGGLDGVQVVDLMNPPTSWSGVPLGAPAANEDELNISATGRQSVLNDTYVTREEVRQLPPGVVLYSVWEHPFGGLEGNEQAPLADFAAVACSGRGRHG